MSHGTLKSPKSPKSPKSSKSPGTSTPVKHRGPDKISYYPLTAHPKFVFPIRNDAERIHLFRKRSPPHDLFKYFMNTAPQEQYAEYLDKIPDNRLKVKARKSAFRSKLKADELALELKNRKETLDMHKRTIKLHDFQAKKENRFREQADLLKQWHSDNPPYAGESATTSYVDPEEGDDDSEDPSSPLFGSSYGYKPLTPAGTGSRQKERADRERGEIEKSDIMWKEFRANQIIEDGARTRQLERHIREIESELKQINHAGGGRKATMRRHKMRSRHSHSHHHHRHHQSHRHHNTTVRR